MKRIFSVLLFIFCWHFGNGQELIVGVPGYDAVGITETELVSFVKSLDGVSEVLFNAEEELLLISTSKRLVYTPEQREQWKEFVLSSLENYHENLRIFPKYMREEQRIALYRKTQKAAIK